MGIGSVATTLYVDDLALQALNLLANPSFELDTNGDGKPDSWSTNL